jgi:glycosyltransferase involved in cell wall biosynthesis
MARPLRALMLDPASIVSYYIGHLAASLGASKDVELRVASIDYHLDREYFRRQGVDNRLGLLDFAWRIPWRPLRRIVKAGEYAANLTSIYARCLSSRPDVVHVQFLPLLAVGSSVDLWFLRALRRAGIAVVYTVHNVLPHEKGDTLRRLYRSVYQAVDRLICHDEAARERLINEFDIAPDSISVVRHGPLFAGQASGTHEARRALKLPAGHFVALWQGIIRPYKGVSFLLEAWRRVHDAEPAATLAVVGTGDAAYVRDIRERVSALGLESSVRLELRFAPVEELALFFSASDALVYPYSEITMSAALMTGLSFGKPVIASRLPAFERLFKHGDNALLVPYGDVQGLSEAFLMLIRDADLRSRLAGRIQTGFSADLEWADISRDTVAAYHLAVQRARRNTHA